MSDFSIQPNNQSLYLDMLPPAISIGMTTLGGTVVGGRCGGIIGLISGLVDEYSMSQKYTDKHYVSMSTFWTSMVLYPIATAVSVFFPSHQTRIHATSFAVGAIAVPYFTSDFLDYRDKITLPVQSFVTVNNFFEDQELSDNEFFISSMASIGLTFSQLVINNLFLLYLKSYGSNLFITTLLRNHEKSISNSPNLQANMPLEVLLKCRPTFIKILYEGLRVLGLYASKEALQLLIELKQQSIHVDQFNLLTKKSTEILLKSGNGRKILAAPNGKEIIQNLNYDLFKLIFKGSMKLNDIAKENSEALIALHNLAQIAKDAFAIYALAILPQQILLQHVVNESKLIIQNLSEARTKTWMLDSEVTSHMEQINLRDGESFLKYRYNNLLGEQNSLTQKDLNLKILQKALLKFTQLFNNLLDIGYFGTKTLTKQLTIGEIPILKVSIDRLASFLSSNLNFQISNTDLLLSIKRITALFEILKKESKTELKRTVNTNNTIIFKNYKLSLSKDKLLEIDYFEFNPKNRYAITGKSGCGKTSALIDIKAGVKGALHSSGEISVSDQNPHIMFIDQNLYLPKDVTLLESIYFPNILKDLSREETLDLTKRVLNLFEELDIDPFVERSDNIGGLSSKLNSKAFKLSGGQAKKIGFIQAILLQPEVLILDETFTGLDKNSLSLVQQSIKKYLPKTLILSVDHHAQDNNFEDFYDVLLHFEKGSPVETKLGVS